MSCKVEIISGTTFLLACGFPSLHDEFPLGRTILRKGLECHNEMVSGLLNGVQLQGEDRVYFVDVLPNEYLGLSIVFSFQQKLETLCLKD